MVNTSPLRHGAGQRRGLTVVITPESSQVVRVDLSGEVDLVTRQQLLDGLSEAVRLGRHTVLLGLAEVGFCDVRGVCALAAFSRVVSRQGGRVTVEGASDVVRQVAGHVGAGGLLRFE